MSILNIRPAALGQSKAIIGIAGTSGEGKTYTALLIARGMVSKASEIGFLDTENKRGSLYADILDEPFMIGDLYPPFSPERYAEAIKEFQNAGIKVLVIDSVSHEWEGEGGCDDIANAPLAAGKKMANWIGAKRSHKKFMNTLLQCNMNVIVCIRAREKTDFKNPTLPISLGIQPICEKNFMFELTASFLMKSQGKEQTFLKLPSFLINAFGDGKNYLGIETGKKISEWLEKGDKESAEILKYKSELLMICEKGLKALEDYWTKLPTEAKVIIKPFLNTYAESAKAYDKQATEAIAEPTEILIEDLQMLFDIKKGVLTSAEIKDAERILDVEKPEAKSFQKLQTLLQSK